MKHYRVAFLAVLAAILLACRPTATSTPEARIPGATRAPVSGESAGITAELLATATIEPSAELWQTFASKDGGFTLFDK